MLTIEQRQRYARNLAIRNFTEENQLLLAESSVLVVGAGALGSLAATYLAATGIGRIGIADFDTIDLSNLQRQILYSTELLGVPKVDALAQHINNLNPHSDIVKHQLFLRDDETARRIIDSYDLIVEGSDSPDAKIIMERLALSAGKPIVIGGVSEWNGQVMTVVPGHTTFTDVFGDSPTCTGFTPCSSGGVLGPVPGVVASIQATEMIKLITGHGETLIDKVLLFDALNMTFRTLKVG